VSASFLEVNPG